MPITENAPDPADPQDPATSGTRLDLRALEESSLPIHNSHNPLKFPDNENERVLIPEELSKAAAANIFDELLKMSIPEELFRTHGHDLGVSPTYVSGLEVFCADELNLSVDQINQVRTKFAKERITGAEHLNGSRDKTLERYLTRGVSVSNVGRLTLWPAYVALAESLRNKSIEAGEQTQHPNFGKTGPSGFYFRSGVYGVVSNPLFVGVAPMIPLEYIIRAISFFGRSMNTVTDLSVIEKPIVIDEKQGITKVVLERKQNQRSLQLFEELLSSSIPNATAQRIKNIRDAICSRDEITTIGACFGAAYLSGSQVLHVGHYGDPATTTQLALYYQTIGEGTLARVGKISSALDLLAYQTTGYFEKSRAQFLTAQMRNASNALHSVALLEATRETQKAQEERQIALEQKLEAEKEAADVRLGIEKARAQIEIETAEKQALEARTYAAEAGVALERARAETEAIKRERLEARLKFEETVGEINRTVAGVNQNVQMMRGILHDLKNSFNGERERVKEMLITVSQNYPDFIIDPNSLRSEKDLKEKVEMYLADKKLPEALRKTAEYVIRTRENLEAMLLKAGEGMKEEISIQKSECAYYSILTDAIQGIKPMYPHVQITVNCPNDILVTIDKAYIEAALKNIIDNAAHASVPYDTNESGTVSLYVKQISRKNRGIITETTVEQSGPMSQEVADRLNAGERFTTKGAKGNGVGSAAAIGIIKLHSGSLMYNPSSLEEKAYIRIRF